MMASMQNICYQLMKSPKELAAWNFPLSQILEEYFDSLPEPSKIHYGEAALIIQNSVNAYVRRVEELYGEIKCLSQKIILESKEDVYKQFQKEQKSKRSLIDFSQFELLHFDKEMGKNINLKNQEGKSIKFLHHCFCQLENLHARMHIEVFDIQNEVIGKKYDFRCNQRLSKNGNLVEECTPVDIDQNYENNTLMITERSKTNKISGRIFNGSFSTVLKLAEANNCTSSNESECTMTECFQDDFDIDIGEECEHSSGINKIDNNYPNTNIGTDSHSMRSHLQDDNSKIDSSITKIQSQESEVNLNLHNLQVKNPETELESDSKLKNGTENIQNTKKNNQMERSESDLNDTVGTRNCSNTLRRSKRFKPTNEDTDNCILDNINLLKPIPFKDGIPEKFIKSRKEFRLPCHINLLKSTSRKRKHVKAGKNVLKQPSKEASTNIADQIENSFKSNKMELYSPTRTEFMVMKEEDRKAFQRPLNDSFNIKQRFAVNYEPVTTLTMDLLGFHPNYAKDDYYLEYSERTPSSPTDSSCSSPNCTPSYPSDILTPPLSSSFDIFSTQKKYGVKKMCVKPGYNFEKLVKRKIKKIYEELDVQTDEDQKVAKWHKEIKPKLMEAERKPPFRIHEYESRIIQKLEMCDRKLQFDEIVCEEPPYEIARYFSATLQLASTNNLNINSSEDLHKSIELVLLD